jgi:ankyrin repeat protein
MTTPSSIVKLRKGLFYHNLPAELDNHITEIIFQDDIFTAVRTLWSLSLTSRDFHEHFNVYLYQAEELANREFSRKHKSKTSRKLRKSAMTWAAESGNMETFSLILKYAPDLCKLKHLNKALMLEHVEMAERLFELETMPAKLVKHKRCPRKRPTERAVKLGLTDLVSRMLDAHGPLSPAVLVSGFDSMLSMACELGHVDIVRLLLEQDPDPAFGHLHPDLLDAVHIAFGGGLAREENYVVVSGVSFWVRTAGLYDIAKLLLESYPQVATETEYLFTAAASGQLDMFNLLLEHGAQIPTDQVQVDRLLHRAICGRSLPLVRTLLTNGADTKSISLRTISGDNLSAMQCGALSKEFHKLPSSVTIVQELLKHRASAGTSVTSALSDNIKDKSPLRIAIEVDDVALVEYLLNLDAHMAEGEHGLPGSVRSIEMLKLLQQRGMGIDGYYHGEDDNRRRHLPIITVARNSQGNPYDHDDVFRYFVENVADINASDASGKTVLHHCCEVVDNEKDYTLARISYLLDKKADIFLADELGRTPFHLAAQSGTSKALQLLTQHGADPHRKDTQGRTPLHHLWEIELPLDTGDFAVSGDVLEKLEILLLECKADPDARATDGTYALHLPTTFQFWPSDIGHILATYAHAMFPNQCAGPFESHEGSKCEGCIGYSDRHPKILTIAQRRNIFNRLDRHGKLYLVQRVAESTHWPIQIPELKELLRLGMDAKQAESDGQTVLMAKRALLDRRIRKLLLNQGVNINAMNEDGNTMLDFMQEHSDKYLQRLDIQGNGQGSLNDQPRNIKRLRKQGARRGSEIRGEVSTSPHIEN